MIWVVVHGTLARSFTQVSKSWAYSRSVDERAGAAATRRSALPEKLAAVASASSRWTARPMPATTAMSTTTASTTKGHRRRRRAGAACRWRAAEPPALRPVSGAPAAAVMARVCPT